MFAFEYAAKLVGANSQCFISASDTNLASFGSSTSIATGKSTPKIKDALVLTISSIL